MRFRRVSSTILLAMLVALTTAAPTPAAEDDAVDPRIVGGTEVAPGAYPFVVSLVWSDIADASSGHRCGGALLTSEWVLTAAHCVSRYDPGRFDVVAGREDLSSSDGERIAVAEIHEHPGWDPLTYENDIAVLRLREPASVGSPISWVTPAAFERIGPGTVLTVIGWGVTEDEPPGTGTGVQDRLREADVPWQTDAECAAAVPENDFFPESMLCAGYPEGGIDSCQGDSGGPAFVFDGDRFRQVGIVSWGYGCADAGQYGYYTRISAYDDWIVEATGLTACEGVVATVVGTDGDDHLTGTSGPDVMVGGDGDDILQAGYGDDIVCGGPGNDWVYGGPGDDLLFGGPNLDRLFGTGGADELHGGDQRDLIRGGPDDDLVFGEHGPDTIRTHGGADVVYGGLDGDTVYGGSGDDLLDGGDGDDALFGVTGDDLIEGGDGDDEVRGQGGDDVVRGGDGDDRVYGGPGVDTLAGGFGVDECRWGEVGLWHCEIVV